MSDHDGTKLIPAGTRPETRDAAPQAALDEIPSGAIWDERLRIERTLGKGGVGCVYAARRLDLGDVVAIKVLLSERSLDPQNRERLLREARASVQIKSEHVVRVLGIVSREDRPAYIIMEHLLGEDLKQRLERKHRLGVEEATQLIAQACEAIGEGHHLGIIHRDLKPGNLFVCSGHGRSRFVKVLDFGISKSTQPELATLTRTHDFLGSPAYSPPEQLRAAAAVDLRADIWALGVILYECLVGQRPFDGATLPELCTAILDGVPTLPRALRHDLPRSIERTILRCLEKEPARRFQSIEEFVSSLREHAPGAVEHCLAYLAGLRGVGTSSVQSIALTKTLAAPLGRKPAAPRRRRAFWGLLLVLGLLCSLVLGGGLWRTAARRNAERSLAVAAPSSAAAALKEVAAPPLVSASTDRPEVAPSAVTDRPDAGRAQHARPRTPKPVPRPPVGVTSVRIPSAPWVDSR